MLEYETALQGIFSSFEHRGEQVLAIRLGSRRAITRSHMERIQQSTNLLVSRDGTITTWSITGFTTKDEAVFALGPIPGKLGSTTPPVAQEADALIQKMRSLAYAEHHRGLASIQGLLPWAVIACSEVDLVLDPGVVAIMRSTLPKETLDILVAPYVFTKSTGLYALHAAFAVEIYRILCKKKLPFEAHGTYPAQDIQNRRIITPPEVHGCRLDNILYAWIRSILVERKSPPSLLSWTETNWSWSVSEPDDESRAEATRNFQKQLSGLKNVVWWRKNSGRIGAIAAVTGVVAFFAIALLAPLTEPPRQTGMKPSEVIGEFYQAAGNFDMDFMADVVGRGKSNFLYNLAEAVMLNTRIRSGMEQREVHYSPTRWRQLGFPRLTRKNVLFGFDDLGIEMIGQSETLAKARVTYRFVNTMDVAYVEGDEDDFLPRFVDVVDEITLERQGEVWVLKQHRSTLAGDTLPGGMVPGSTE